MSDKRTDDLPEDTSFLTEDAAPAQPAQRERSLRRDRETRVPRNVQMDAERGASLRDKEWLPPNALPEPAPQDGYVFRWVRTHLRGTADDQNVAVQMQQGWEPVKLADVPEVAEKMRFLPQNDGYVRIGGLMLCKCPAELMKQREDYYERRARNQQESVDNSFLRLNNPLMPLLKPERSSRTSRGPRS